MAKTFEEYKADADKQTAESRKKNLGSIDSSADAAIKLAEDTYKTAEANTIVDYASDYERNAVQKLINEKKIAERSANLGLTDSGLNRTQQTAVQLSYANQKGKLDIAKQQALDKLSSDLASYVTKVNNQREADKMSVNQFYDQQNNTIATELYNTDVEDSRKRWETEYNAGIELQKAAIEASANQLREKTNILNSKNSTLGDLKGTFANKGITTIHNADGSTTYTDTITGISVTMDEGINPFTGQNNLTENTVTAKSAQKYGTFSNGYQPKGIVGYGNLSVAVKNSDGTALCYEMNGRNCTIWKAKDNEGSTHYFVWDGNNNEYIEITSSQFEKAYVLRYSQ